MGQVIVFNMLPAVPGLILAFSLFWILGAFPGVNMIWGMVIAFVLASFHCHGFWLAGSGYAAHGRRLHPGQPHPAPGAGHGEQHQPVLFQFPVHRLLGVGHGRCSAWCQPSWWSAPSPAMLPWLASAMALSGKVRQADCRPAQPGGHWVVMLAAGIENHDEGADDHVVDRFCWTGIDGLSSCCSTARRPSWSALTPTPDSTQERQIHTST